MRAACTTTTTTRKHRLLSLFSLLLLLSLRLGQRGYFGGLETAIGAPLWRQRNNGGRPTRRAARPQLAELSGRERERGLYSLLFQARSLAPRKGNKINFNGLNHSTSISSGDAAFWLLPAACCLLAANANANANANQTSARARVASHRIDL